MRLPPPYPLRIPTGILLASPVTATDSTCIPQIFLGILFLGRSVALFLSSALNRPSGDSRIWCHQTNYCFPITYGCAILIGVVFINVVVVIILVCHLSRPHHLSHLNRLSRLHYLRRMHACVFIMYACMYVCAGMNICLYVFMYILYAFLHA